MKLVRWRNRKKEEKTPEPIIGYNETAVLIGEAVAEVIPEYAIEKTTVFDITMDITRRPHQLSQKETIRLKMRIDSGLCVQMMEYPMDAPLKGMEMT